MRTGVDLGRGFVKVGSQRPTEFMTKKEKNVFV